MFKYVKKLVQNLGVHLLKENKKKTDDNEDGDKDVDDNGHNSELENSDDVKRIIKMKLKIRMIMRIKMKRRNNKRKIWLIQETGNMLIYDKTIKPVSVSERQYW